MTVNCGHFDDPVDRQGMAHFLEHMLFLGTKSYPEPGEYSQYINNHGGSNNAWTSTEFTSYFFDINTEFLPEALCRFSQFFTEPLFCEQYIDKERQAIDAEYKLKLKEDTHRIYQVQKETINQDHPFSKFSVGNIDTLADRNGVSIRQELVEFHHKYYVPEHMALVMCSAMPLTQQRTWIEQRFNKLEKRQGPCRIIDTPIYTDDKQLEIFIKPHKNAHTLVASFTLPCEDKYYVNKTMNYIAHLIGHEGPGSILSLLKRFGWCNGLSAGRGISGSNFKDFNVSFDLTEQGLEHCNEIISIFYQYLEKIKQCDHHQSLYKDKKKLLQLAFDYQEKSKSINLVSHLSVNMFHYKPEHYIFGDYIMNEFCQEEFDEICELLAPTNLRLVHINPQVKGSKKAKWYHTPYHVSEISAARIERFKQSNTPNDELFLPSVNPYLQNDIILEPKGDCEAEIPEIIFKSDAYNFWFMQDKQFNVPKGHCYIAIDCPISTSSINNIAITRLFNELFLDSVIEDHYSAELAGLSYHIYVHQGGLTVHTSGLSTNQHLLIEKLLVDLHRIEFNRPRFEELKKQLITHWKNSSKSKPISQLFSVLTSTLQPNNPTMGQMAEALETVSFDEFLSVQKNLFTQVHVEAFAYGNWTKAQALELTDRIGQLLLENTEPHKEVFRPVLSLQQQNNIAIKKKLQHHDNAIVMYYQGEQNDPKTCALFILLNHVIGPEFFHQLRTEKQLGYLVGTGFVPLNRYPGLATYIQSPNNQACKLHKEITLFYEQFCTELLDVGESQWQKIQQGLIIQVLERDRNLRILSQRYWTCIGNKDFTFNERESIAEHIINTSPKDLHKFAKKVLLQYQDCKLTVMTQSDTNGEQLEQTELNFVTRESLKQSLTTLNKPE